MSRDLFDAELDMHYDSLEETGECQECLGPVELGKTYCSIACYKASQY